MKAIRIGEQIWADSNLAVTKFNNGDAIPLMDPKEFKQDWRFGKKWEKYSDERKPVCTLYKGEIERRTREGVLYNWFAANDERGICPDGWVIPSINDWIKLALYLKGSEHLEKTEYQETRIFKGFSSKLKSKTGWDENLNGTDEYGFNLQALGNIGSIGDWRPIYKFTSMSFWTSSDYEFPYDQWVDTPFFVDDDMIINKGLKHSGYHVRCIRSECSLKQ
jgi:uncharacterized protein (TIGR02145 family)